MPNSTHPSGSVNFSAVSNTSIQIIITDENVKNVKKVKK